MIYLIKKFTVKAGTYVWLNKKFGILEIESSSGRLIISPNLRLKRNVMTNE